MQAAARRNRRATSRSEKLFSVGGAAAGTLALLVAMVWLLGADRISFEGTSYAATVPVEDVDLQTTCKGDVLLATASRAAMCLSPWRDGSSAEQCSDDITMMMWMDLSACDARSSPIAPIAMAMVQPREIEKLTPIDPEPLLEELMQKEKEQPKPLPPPPQPQVQQQPPPPPPPPPPPQRKSQVVETVKPNKEEAPNNARLLSEYDVKVEKQKVARGAADEPLVAKSKPKDLIAKKEPPKEDPSMQKPPEKPPGKNERAPDNPNTLSMRAPGTPAPTKAPQEELHKGDRNDSKQPVLSGGMVPRRGDGAIEQSRKDPGELTKGQGGGGGGVPQVPNLKPTKEQLERIVGGGNVDHLDDVENGDETALNAKRWIYASFFNRLKRQVAQNWDPQTVWRRVDPQGTHHGFKTRVTEVRVVLSAKGELSKIVVVSPSGVGELDDEAVRSFHAAAPFPNPPEGLAGKDGNITFAFSFFFEIGTPHTSWRVIKN